MRKVDDGEKKRKKRKRQDFGLQCRTLIRLKVVVESGMVRCRSQIFDNRVGGKIR